MHMRSGVFPSAILHTFSVPEFDMSIGLSGDYERTQTVTIYFDVCAICGQQFLFLLYVDDSYGHILHFSVFTVSLKRD